MNDRDQADDGYCGILLAAGRSTRFGSDKLLHPLADGTAVAVASAKALLAVMPRVVAVVGARNADLQHLLAAAGVIVVTAPSTDIGMGHSLAAGVAAAANSAGWVVALADMPFIRPVTIAGVLGALQSGADLAAPVLAGQRGHPVGFSRRFRADLLVLQGDEGARQVLRRHQHEMALVACDDPGILRDIDQPGDLPPAS